MNVTLTGAIRPAKPNKIPGFVNEVNGKYRATKTLTDQQIINAAQAILNNRFRPGVLITSWDAMETWLQLHYQNFDIEVFVGIFLTTNHYIIAHEILFRGTLDAASVYPREIAKRALQLNAGAIIFAHNHPSGIIDPSPGDEDITRKLKASLALFDITVLDHFVIGKGGAFSFANHNLL